MQGHEREGLVVRAEDLRERLVLPGVQDVSLMLQEPTLDL